MSALACVSSCRCFADDVLLQEIAHRSLANQAGFRTFVCEFDFQAGEAESRERLIAGDFTVIQGTATGRWAKRADEELFNVDVGDLFVGIPGADGRVNIPFAGGEKAVFDGQRGVVFQDLLQVAKLGGSGDMRTTAMDLSPWKCLGRISSGTGAVPGASLLQNVGLPAPFGNSIEERESIIAVQSDLGDFSLLFEFDKSKNYLPVHVSLGGQRSNTNVETVEAIEVDGIGWFPGLLIAYALESGATQPRQCYRFAVREFAYREPSDEELSFTSPIDYQLHGPEVIVSENLAYVAEGAAVHPGMLKELSDTLDRAGVYGGFDVSQPAGDRRWRIATALILLAFAVTGLAARYYRRTSVRGS